MSIGARIRKERLAKGLSQQALGDILGVSRVAVSNWEREQEAGGKGGNNPLHKRVSDIAAALECSLSYLLLGVKDDTAPPARPDGTAPRQEVPAAPQMTLDRHLLALAAGEVFNSLRGAGALDSVAPDDFAVTLVDAYDRMIATRNRYQGTH